MIVSNAKVIYPLFMKRASLNKRRIDYLIISVYYTGGRDKLRNIYAEVIYPPFIQ